MDGKNVETVGQLNDLLDNLDSGDTGQVEDEDENEEVKDDESDDEDDFVEDENEEVKDDESDDEDDFVEDEDEDEDDTTNKKAKTSQKDHHAFAAMRKQNKQLQEAIDNLARGLGIDPKEDDALAKLNDLAYNGIAKRSGRKKEEVIADSKAQKELQAYRQRDIQSHAERSLKNIKDEFGASPERLKEFVGKLNQSGYRILGQKEDWEGLYKNMYFDEIVEKRVAAEVEKALKRDESANKNSGKSKKRSKGSAGKNKIDSVAKLDKFLDSLSK